MGISITAGSNIHNVTMVKTIVTGELSGVVSDQDGAPIFGVAVKLAGTTTSTNSAGRYGFTGIPVGTYTLTFTKEGYNALTL